MELYVRIQKKMYHCVYAFTLFLYIRHIVGKFLALAFRTRVDIY